ncbi:glycosyltransferase [Phycicoccus avicenniae]|uniref:glycosyltransferase n=1 Tax=Phycicoccus avicenniae TaxID=2828860 RepID=UPI003D291561
MIRVMAPDLPTPSGGIKVIYNYVEHLVALGHDARVWHGTPGFAYPDWGSTAPVDTGLRLPFAAGDVIVMPETGGGRWSDLNPGVPHVMLCQGMDFVFMDAEFTRDVPGDYPGWPQATCALGVSDAIVTFLEHACPPGFPVHAVPVEIERWFVPLEKERRIALMPRRRREDLIGAVQLVRRSGRLRDWEIVLIDGMTQAQVAEELGRAAIFLFGAEREGFGLPGAEAMAAGCYVVGFTGDGAKEYLTDDVASVVLDSDVVGMSEATLAAMDAFDGDRTALDAKVALGRSRVLERHSAEAVRAALGRAFAEITAEGSPSVLPESTTLSHYASRGPRYGRAGAVYVGARSVAGAALRRARRLRRP